MAFAGTICTHCIRARPALVELRARAVQRAEAEARKEAKLKPNKISYTAVIDACAKQGEVAKAEGWLPKMQGAGLQPDVISYSTVINACAKAGEAAKAELYLSTMQGAGLQPNLRRSSSMLIVASWLPVPSWIIRCQELII